MKSLLLLLLATVVSASTPADARLASARKAFVMPVDELGDDKAVVSCLTDRLGADTALTPVTTPDEADVVLRIAAHLPSTTAKYWLGDAVTPSAHVFVELPDGTKLWDDGVKYRATHHHLHSDVGKSIECGLADELANTLRDAMRKARDHR